MHIAIILVILLFFFWFLSILFSTVNTIFSRIMKSAAQIIHVIISIKIYNCCGLKNKINIGSYNSINNVLNLLEPDKLNLMATQELFTKTSMLLEDALTKTENQQAEKLHDVCIDLKLQVNQIKILANNQEISLLEFTEKLKKIKNDAHTIIKWCESQNTEPKQSKSNYLDYYKILEIEKNASALEIKKEYRFQISVWHPDRFGNPEAKKKAETKTKLINEAYQILSDPQKRKEYDLTVHQ